MSFLGLLNLCLLNVCVTVAATANIDVNTRPHPRKEIHKLSEDFDAH